MDTDSLSELYQLPAASHCLVSEYNARGLIVAVAASPEIPLPESWMPWLINEKQAQLTNTQVDEIAHFLMLGLRDSLDSMRQDQPVLPANCSWAEAGGNRQRLQQWLSGLLTGHQMVQSIWEQAWQQASDAMFSGQDSAQKRLTRCLKLFSTLARPDIAINARNPQQGQQLKDNLGMLAAQVPSVLNDYIALSGELAGQLPNQFETYVKHPED